MKKVFKYLILPLVFVVSLVSCNTYQEQPVINEAKEAFKNVPGLDENLSYTLEPEGNVAGFSDFNTSRRKGTINKFNTPNGNYGLSFFIHAPLKLSSFNIYPDDPSSVSKSELDNNYAYSKIKDRLTWSSDPNSHVFFKKDGEDYVFYTEGVSKRLTIYNVVTQNYDDEPYISSVVVYSRFNITLKYAADGTLTEENISNVKSLNHEVKNSVDIKASYTYSV